MNANYEDIDSLCNLDLLILYDVENILRIVSYKMFLKYN